jgi:hypothetical protein
MVYFMKGCGKEGRIKNTLVQCGITEKINQIGKIEKIYCISCKNKFAKDKENVR